MRLTRVQHVVLKYTWRSGSPRFCALADPQGIAEVLEFAVDVDFRLVQETGGMLADVQSQYRVPKFKQFLL